MENFSHDDHWQEIVFASSEPKQASKIHRAVKNGELKKIAPRIYTTNLQDSPEEIIKRNRYQIISFLYPNAVISYRSALEGGVSPSGLIVLSYKYTKKISLPGLTIRLVEGPGKLPGDTLFMGELFLASRPRALLENLTQSKGKSAKSLGQKYVETHLDKLARIHGPEELNSIRDQARKIASSLNLKDEFNLLDRIIGTILRTQTADLISPAAQSRAAGKPYDTDRIELFASLSESLISQILQKKKEGKQSKQWINNLAFFEAYFSNYTSSVSFSRFSSCLSQVKKISNGTKNF